MTRDAARAALLETLDTTLDELRRQFDDATWETISVPEEPLPNLLEQCEAIYNSPPARQPLRTIHHFACTGGTLISRILAALPNTVVLSEVDPLSTLMLRKDMKPLFAPTDLVLALRYSLRRVEDSTLVSTFLAGLAAAKDGVEARGHHLVLRDHAHSHFCLAEVDPRSRPTLREMLSDRFEMRSVVTIRHPLDSFLSLISNNWLRFEPATLEEYATRYLAFLARHDGIPVLRYEDFIGDPDAMIRQLCGLLDLRHTPLAADLVDIIPMTGDSGRKGGQIARRPRRQVPQDIEGQRHQDGSYRQLCTRFGYDP
jgi:hypothetical protein